MKLTSDSGNILLETALAISIFGCVLLPIGNTVATVATGVRNVQLSSTEVARAWSDARSVDRLVTAQTQANLFRRNNPGLSITISCTPKCTEPMSSVQVLSRQELNLPFLNSVSASQTLESDWYAP